MKRTRIHERLQEGWQEFISNIMSPENAPLRTVTGVAGLAVANRVYDKLAKRKADKLAKQRPYGRSKRTPEFLANRQKQSDLKRFKEIQNEKTPLSDYNP